MHNEHLGSRPMTSLVTLREFVITLLEACETGDSESSGLPPAAERARLVSGRDIGDYLPIYRLC